jgi:hypothetical protein
VTVAERPSIAWEQQGLVVSAASLTGSREAIQAFESVTSQGHSSRIGLVIGSSLLYEVSGGMEYAAQEPISVIPIAQVEAPSALNRCRSSYACVRTIQCCRAETSWNVVVW